MKKLGIFLAVGLAMVSNRADAQTIDKAFVITVPVQMASMEAGALAGVTCTVRTGTTVNGTSTRVSIPLDAAGSFSGSVSVEVPNTAGDPAAANAYECKLTVWRLSGIGETRIPTEEYCGADLGTTTAAQTYCRSKTGTVFVGTVTGTLP